MRHQRPQDLTTGGATISSCVSAPASPDRTKTSIQLDIGELDHLGPFRRIGFDQLLKILALARKRRRTDLVEPLLQGWIGERGVDLAVQLVEDFGRRFRGRAKTL